MTDLEIQLRRRQAWIVWVIFLLVFGANVCRAQQHVMRQLAAGVIHHEYYLPQGPWSVHALEVDLSFSNLTIETAKAHSKLMGRAKTSVLADSLLRCGQNLIGGVNGDFFSNEGIPVGCQVLGGVPLKNPSARSAFIVTQNMRPAIETVRLHARLITSNGKTVEITGINSPRNEDDLVLYNAFKGGATRTNAFGAEAMLRPLNHSDGEGYATCEVISIVDNHGDSPITDGNWVLSAHGKSRKVLLESLRPGQRVKILISFPPIRGLIYSMAGGGPRILRNGAISIENVQENISDAFCQARHPRTAIGFSQDSSKVFLVTVDGRQPGFSVGMTLSELAEFMWSLGAWQAMNLDGGGSTTMVAKDQVLNSPSDATGERPIANALFVIAKPASGKGRRLEIEPPVAWLGLNTEFKFKVCEYDENGRYAVTTRELIDWKCDKRIGKMRRDGELVVAGRADSGFVWMRYHGRTDSARVYILPVESVVISPGLMTTAVNDKISLRAYAFAKNNVKLSNTRFDWSVSSGIGKTTGDGSFIPRREGRTTVRAAFCGIWDEAEVEVKALH